MQWTLFGLHIVTDGKGDAKLFFLSIFVTWGWLKYLRKDFSTNTNVKAIPSQYNEIQHNLETLLSDILYCEIPDTEEKFPNHFPTSRNFCHGLRFTFWPFILWNLLQIYCNDMLWVRDFLSNWIRFSVKLFIIFPILLV